jgi:hypothetical protein
MAFDDGPDPLSPGFFEPFRAEAQPGGNPLFAPHPCFHLIVGFHSLRLTIGPLAVQQGSLLFEDTKFGEEFSDLGSVATDCLGDIRGASGSEEADSRIPDGGDDFRTGTFSDPACVFPESDVAHVYGSDSRMTSGFGPMQATDLHPRVPSERW